MITRRASAAEARLIQGPVLRPHGSVPGDTAPKQDWVYLVALAGDTVIAAATLAPLPWRHGDLAVLAQPSWQLRSMAVLPEWQGQGAGSRLLQATVAEALVLGARSLWAEARLGAVPFYLTAGWQVHGAAWDKPGVGPHRYVTLVPATAA